MPRHFLRAALVAIFPAAGMAGNIEPVEIPVIATPIVVTPSPDLIFTVRGGVSASPTYFGSDSYEAGPDFGLSFQFVKLPGGRSIGSTDPDYRYTGFSPHGSLRLVKARKSSDHAELAGLSDIDMSLELGLGLGYTSDNFRAFGDVRYGVVGHEAWVAEFGADLMARPTDRLTLTAGPRLFVADNSYATTYFGVTAAESVASGGAFAAYAPSGGALSAGFEVGANYALNDKWGIEGAVRYDRLLNSAADSPITAQGSADQFSARLGLTRRFTLDF